MANEVDELFGEAGGAPQPRRTLAVSLLATGLLASAFGLVCCTAPGALLVLWAWFVVEKDLDRVDTGFLATEARPGLELLQRATYAALVLVIVLFVVQGVLVGGGFYDRLWGSMLSELYDLFPAPEPPPAP